MYLGMKLGHWQDIRDEDRGTKWSLLSLCGQRFPGYGPIFKISILGYETWLLARVPAVAHRALSTPGVGIELIFALQATVSEIRADF